MSVRPALVAVAFLFSLAHASGAQELVLLRITVTIVDADHHPRPVPRHALLISVNPTNEAPRRAVTDANGRAEVRLRPGNYTVESDFPLVFQGKAYQWRETMDVAAGRDAVLELTAAKAEIVASSSASTMTEGETAPSELLMQWQDSVVAIWSPTARGAGVLVDSRGLIVTNQRLVGAATSAEVQLTPKKKVVARVLAADRERDIALLWIDPAFVSSIKPARLGYSQPGAPPVAAGQPVFAFDTAGFDQKSLASGTVTRVDTKIINTDVRSDSASSGTPLLTATGEVIAITTLAVNGDSKDATTSSRSNSASRAVRIDEARTLIADVEKTLHGGTSPPGTLRPVEPPEPFPESALEDAVKRRSPTLAAYHVLAADFDVTIVTPAQIYRARHRPDRTTGATTPGGRQDIEMLNAQRALEDFGNWSDYVADSPAVLMIRATPKLVEDFWKTVGRVAASTQGVSLPAFKRLKTGFADMRLYCGDAEVVPIHPFKIERRLDDRNAVYEGLYVFDPGAIAPTCGTVRLTLFSEKTPDKGDRRVVDARVVQQIWDDFAPYRSPK
jgi:S1-C subfamily serine protease